jgi:hypothetical protein
MEFIESLTWTFVVALTTTFAVALIARLGGVKLQWTLMLGVAVGITAAQAINTVFAIPLKWHPLIAGASTGTCILVAQLLVGNLKRKV